MQITINNNKKTLILSRANGYTLIEVTGLDPVKADITSSKRIGTGGMIVTNATPSGRALSIQLTLEGTNPAPARKKLFNVCLIGDLVTVLIEVDGHVYSVEGYVEDIQVKYWQNLQAVQLDIFCQSPYLESPEDLIVVSALSDKRFKFPFNSDYTQSFIFGEVLDKMTAIVRYNGELPTGAVFKITAGATLKNPTITNVETGESIGYTGTLASGEAVEICTIRGKRTLRKINTDGTKKTQLSNISDYSYWLDITDGDNYFVLDADEGEKEATLSVTYRERFVGV